MTDNRAGGASGGDKSSRVWGAVPGTFTLPAGPGPPPGQPAISGRSLGAAAPGSPRGGGLTHVCLADTTGRAVPLEREGLGTGRVQQVTWFLFPSLPDSLVPVALPCLGPSVIHCSQSSTPREVSGGSVWERADTGCGSLRAART